MTIVKSNELAEIIESFKKKGGTVNNHYLKTPSKGPVLVSYKKRWYRGKNVKDAISRALVA